MPFLDSLDIANRGMQLLGQSQIQSVSEDTRAQVEASFAYDKLRRAELQRNVWRFAVRKAALRAIDTTTLLVDPPAYDNSKTYLPGALVKDTNGLIWVSLKPDNIDNSPGGNNEYWDAYFGPLTVTLYDSTQTYFAGELVYKAGAVAGSYEVYMSLKSANADAPDTATAWVNTTTYYADQVVSYGGSLWRSLLPFNLGTTPADGPLAWDSTITYTTAQTVTGSDHFIYSSVGNGNLNHDPTTDGGVNWTNTNVANAWSRSPTLVTAATSWLPVGNVALRALTILYPIGSGPLSQTDTKNVYRLPSGYLRMAPQDPKQGSNSLLGAPSGLPYEDWTLEGDYIVSDDSGAIVLRFVADVTRVSKFDDMFCEGLACRIASATCEALKQSTAKLQTIASEYKLFMGEARLRNSIEEGSEEPPLDDYIACRE